MGNGTAAESGLVVRAGMPRDQPAVLALNNAAPPHVNALSEEQFAWIAGEADSYRVAEREGEIVGFVFAIRNGTPYWSANYAWFAERYPTFIYLDRVVVAPAARKIGVGRALYDDLVKFATGRWSRITLEVNTDPPNPGSIAFHERMQFARVGTRRYADGEVAMFERLLAAP